MEAIIPPSPGLYALTLRVLATADPWDSSEGLLMNELARNLTHMQAYQLPHAIGEVLSLLRSTKESLQFASDIIVAFNLYEAAPHLVEIALRDEEYRDRRLILNAASICGHPSIAEDTRAQIAEVVSGIPAARIRLDPKAPTPNERLMRLQRRCWPGLITRDDEFGLPPTVVFDSSVDRRGMLRLASELHLNGYAIRRIGDDGHLPEWFGWRTTVVSTATSAYRPSLAQRLDQGQVVLADDLADDGTLNESALNNVLSDVWETRPRDWRPEANSPRLTPRVSARRSLSREPLPSVEISQDQYGSVLHLEEPYATRLIGHEGWIQKPIVMPAGSSLIGPRSAVEKHPSLGTPSGRYPEYVPISEEGYRFISSASLLYADIADIEADARIDDARVVRKQRGIY